MFLLSTSAAWSPLYDAYHAIAEAYQVGFAMQSIGPGYNIYINTDHSGQYFPDHYAVSIEDESYLTSDHVSQTEEEQENTYLSGYSARAVIQGDWIEWFITELEVPNLHCQAK